MYDVSCPWLSKCFLLGLINNITENWWVYIYHRSNLYHTLSPLAQWSCSDMVKLKIHLALCSGTKYWLYQCCRIMYFTIPSLPCFHYPCHQKVGLAVPPHSQPHSYHHHIQGEMNLAEALHVGQQLHNQLWCIVKSFYQLACLSVQVRQQTSAWSHLFVWC